jgi:hypothetical protein
MRGDLPPDGRRRHRRPVCDLFAIWSDFTPRSWSARPCLRQGCSAHTATHSCPCDKQYTPKHLAEKILTSKAALEGERKQVTVLSRPPSSATRPVSSPTSSTPSSMHSPMKWPMEGCCTNDGGCCMDESWMRWSGAGARGWVDRGNSSHTTQSGLKRGRKRSHTSGGQAPERWNDRRTERRPDCSRCWSRPSSIRGMPSRHP